MSLVSQLQKLIPNPYSKKESLPGYVKKLSLISSGLSIMAAAKKMLFLIILFFILLISFNIPSNILITIFFIELFVVFVTLIFSLLKIKSINKVNLQEDKFGSWKMLIINADFDILAKGVSLIGNMLGVFVFIFALDNKFIDINISPDVVVYAKYFLLIIISLRMAGFVVSIWEYNSIKQAPKSSDISELDKNYGLISMKFEIIRYALILGIILAVIAFILFSGIIPKEYLGALSSILIYTVFPVIILSILFKSINIFSYRRLKKLNLNGQVIIPDNRQANNVNPVKVLEYQDEVIKGTVFGIIKSMASFKDIFSRKMGSYEFLGVGRNFAPENTLLITNRRLLFINVSVTGGDKVINGNDYVMQNALFNRSEIINKGEALLKTKSMSELLSLVRNEVLYHDIDSLKFNKFIISIKKINGEKFRYGFMDKEYAEIIDRILPQYLGSKFISK